MNPSSRDALLLLANAWRTQGQAARAATLLGGLVALQPGDALALRALAAAQLAAGQALKALGTLDAAALGGGALDSAFHLLRAQALIALQRPADAQAAMKAALT
jgi:predicted Zn-dependent protease